MQLGWCTCDARHGRVKALNLSNMGLKGTISPQLGNLSFLSLLDLQGNSFYGQLPQELFRLHRLKLLNLGHNNFSGLIPQSVSNLSMLEHLDFSYNFFKGTIPPVIGQLRQLRILDIRKNKLSGIIPPTVSNLSSLEQIHLSYNSLLGMTSTSPYSYITYVICRVWWVCVSIICVYVCI